MRKPLSSLERADMERIYPYYGAVSIVDYVDDYIFDGEYLLVSEDGIYVVDENGHPLIQHISGKFWANNHAHILKENLALMRIACIYSWRIPIWHRLLLVPHNLRLTKLI